MTYQEALYNARKEGFDEGFKIGFEEGFKEGFQQGLKERTEKMRKAGIKEEEIKAIFDSEKTLAN